MQHLQDHADLVTSRANGLHFQQFVSQVKFEGSVYISVSSANISQSLKLDSSWAMKMPVSSWFGRLIAIKITLSVSQQGTLVAFSGITALGYLPRTDLFSVY